MNLQAKIENPARPVIFYELIPPQAGSVEELETALATIRELVGRVDGINIPEIHEESRRGARRSRLPDRIEPRAFAQAIQKAMEMETAINRVTVHESSSVQLRWMKETYSDYGIRNLILVGGESSKIQYPGPSVLEAASLALREGREWLLGGITIPSRSHEAERIREKYRGGLRFFTTQVLLDSNDTVDLIQGLNGLDVRIFLSFAPISNSRDIEFLEWLGVDVPQNVAWWLAQDTEPDKAVEKTITLAAKILTDVFDNLPPHPPALGINIEQITRRNYKPSLQMLGQLSGFYQNLLQARYAVPGESEYSNSPPGAVREDGVFRQR